MKISSLNDWLALAANVGVLVGLIFLIAELDQTNRVATYSAESARRMQFTQLNEIGMEYSELLVALKEDSPELSESQYLEAYFLALYHMNVWMDGEFALENGLISESTFNEVLSDITAITTQFPGLKAPFSEMVDRYGFENNELETVKKLVRVVRGDGT